MRKNLIALAAAVTAAGISSAAFGQTLAVSIAIRETMSTAAVGSDGGAPSASIEYVNLNGQTLQLNETWQTFTWNFGTDPVSYFAGTQPAGGANNQLDGTRGVLEHLRFTNGIGSADAFEVYFDGIINTVGGSPITISGFESTETPPADITDVNGGFMFRAPTFSGSTSGNLAANPSIAQVTDELADTGTQSLKASWAFIDAAPTRWVRYTTFNAPERGNPVIDFTSGNSLTMRLYGRVVGPSVRWTSTAAAANWSDANNWNAGTVAGATASTSQVAYFGDVNTGPTTITADIPLTLNTLRLRSENPYTFVSSDPNVNVLNMTGPAAVTSTNINVELGSHTINAPIFLPNKALSVTVSRAVDTLTLTSINYDPIGLGEGRSVLKSGDGALVIPNVRAFVNNPDDTAPTPPNPSRSLTINGGKVKLTAGSGTPVDRVNRVIMAGATGAWTTQLDITNHAMILDYADPVLGGTNPRGLQEDRIKQGFAGGAWNGNGIISSVATGAFGVGIVDIADIGTPTEFLGEPVDTTTVIMRFTRRGDANLSGGVDLNDFTVLAANFGLEGRWGTGDFNYDGLVNLDDFTALAANFGLTVPADVARAVPEPTGLAAAALVAGGLIRRRRA